MAKKLYHSSIENLLFLDLPSGSEDELEDGDVDEICVDDNLNCLDIDDNDFLDINWPCVDNDIMVLILEVNQQIQNNLIIINVPPASSFENSQFISNLQPVSSPAIQVTKNTRQSSTQSNKKMSSSSSINPALKVISNNKKKKTKFLSY